MKLIKTTKHFAVVEYAGNYYMYSDPARYEIDMQRGKPSATDSGDPVAPGNWVAFAFSEKDAINFCKVEEWEAVDRRATRRQIAVLETYTGLRLGSDDVELRTYAGDLLGRAVRKHDLAEVGMAAKLRDLSREDYLNMSFNLEGE